MSITIKTKDNSDTVMEKMERGILRFLTEAGIHLEGEAKRELGNEPIRIDTGLLRNSITYALAGKKPAATSYHASKGSTGESAKSKKAGSVKIGFYTDVAPTDKGLNTVYIGTNVEYALYVHEGWISESGKHVEPNRFLKNAIDKNAKQLQEKCGEIIKEEIKK